MNFFMFVGLLGLGYMTGRYIEINHYKRLLRKEEELLHIPVTSGEWKSQINDEQTSELFGAGVVIGADYFKTVVASLRSLVGGRMGSFETLLDRGRREAIIRLKDKANAWGAEKIINVRIETASIGNSSQGKQALPCVEIYAYGTAIKSHSNKSIQV